MARDYKIILPGWGRESRRSYRRQLHGLVSQISRGVRKGWGGGGEGRENTINLANYMNCGIPTSGSLVWHNTEKTLKQTIKDRDRTYWVHIFIEANQTGTNYLMAPGSERYCIPLPISGVNFLRYTQLCYSETKTCGKNVHR